MRSWSAILLLWISGLVSGLQGANVGLIKIKGPIGPATASYIARAIDLAGAQQDICLIIQLDTPGGSLQSTKEIVEKFYESRVPTVVYVAPAGAWAGSAGCFITIAADVAAMAPSTSIGAAHPVSVLPGGGESGDSVMKQKLENFASSYIESIAEKRGRNAEWAKSSVVRSESITATNALELKVIDLIAKDLPELLGELDQREINGIVVGLQWIALVAAEPTFRSHPPMRPLPLASQRVLAGGPAYFVEPIKGDDQNTGGC